MSRPPRHLRPPHSLGTAYDEALHDRARFLRARWMVERIEEWRARSRLLADSEVESAFFRTCKYISLVLQRLSSAKAASLHAKCFQELFFLPRLTYSLQFNSAVSHRERDGNSLPQQPDLLRPSCGGGSQACEPRFRAREGDPSTAIFGVPLHPSLPQDAHNPQRSAGEPQADAILIPSDDEFGDLDGRSHTSFESLDGLLLDVRNKVKSGRVTGIGMCLDLAFLGRPIC